MKGKVDFQDFALCLYYSDNFLHVKQGCHRQPYSDYNQDNLSSKYISN